MQSRAGIILKLLIVNLASSLYVLPWLLEVRSVRRPPSRLRPRVSFYSSPLSSVLKRRRREKNENIGDVNGVHSPLLSLAPEHCVNNARDGRRGEGVGEAFFPRPSCSWSRWLNMSQIKSRMTQKRGLSFYLLLCISSHPKTVKTTL